MPPLTPSRIRAIARPFDAPALGAVLEADLAGGELLEGDRDVVLAALGVDHRRRILAEVALAEVVVVAVDLASPLRRHHHGGLVGVGLREQSVYAWMDHGSESSCSARTSRSSSSAARSSSSLTTRYANSSCAASSCAATASLASIASVLSLPRARSRSRSAAGSGGAMKTCTDSGIAARTWRAPCTSISR